MRKFNGKFWVKREKKRSRAAASRAFAEVEAAARQLQHHERMAQELAASIERKHEIALAMNAEHDREERRTRESWDRYMEASVR